MSDLTKEYFDQKLTELRQDVKDDLKTQTTELKAYADEQTQKLGAMVAETIAEPLEQLKKKVNRHESDISAIKKAIHIH